MFTKCHQSIEYARINILTLVLGHFKAKEIS